MLIGRHRELAQLERALTDARASRGRVVLLAGQPGIGKSRLADEATRAASGMRVLWGRCWEAGGAPPFWPWIQILRALRRDVDVEAPSEIARILPELGGATAAPVPVVEQRFLLFDAIQRYASAAAAATPIVIVLEDLHAADVASLQVLEFFATHLRGEAICVVGTYRTSEARTTPEVNAAIARLARDAEIIEPRPLAREDIAAIAHEGGVVDPQVIDAVARASEGNPLFVRELVRLGASVIPETVRAAIREHLQRVPISARTVAERAAVLGGELPGELARLCEITDTGLARELGSLVDHGVLVELAPRRWQFAHGLFAETLVHDLAPDERERLHGRAADLLASAGASAAEVTRHLFAAGSARVTDAIVSARRGAADASRQLAFAEAAALLARARDAAPGRDSALAIDLAIELAGAQIAAGDSTSGIATCLRAAELARARGDATRLAQIASTYGRVITPGQTDRTLVSLIEEALAALPAGDTAERARLLARLASALQPAADPDGPIAIAREAIAIARRLGEPKVVLEVLFSALSAFANFADPAERRALDDEVLALAQAHGEAPMVLRAHYRLVLDALGVGDLAGALVHQRAFDQIARDVRQPQIGWMAALLRALFALHTGRIAESEADQAEAGRLVHDLGSQTFWYRGFSLMSKVALADVEGLRAERDLLARGIPGAFYLYETVTIAYVDMLVGDMQRARAQLARVTVRELVAFRDMYLLAIASELAIALGDRAWATELYAALPPFAHRWCNSGLPNLSIEPSIRRPLGLLAAFLGHRAEARAHFAAAIAELRAAGLPVLLARTLVEWAACGAADEPEAERARTEARELATRLGLPVLIRLDVAPVAAPASAPLALADEGATWLVSLGANTARVKPSRGIELLARLVAEPGREVHVLELVGADAADTGDAGEVLDREAIAAYRARVIELRELIEETTSATRRDRARAELEALEDQLSAAVGVGGRKRRASNAAERARVNVQRRLADAIKRVSEAAPAIGEHVELALRTGTYCSYDPRRASTSSS